VTYSPAGDGDRQVLGEGSKSADSWNMSSSQTDPDAAEDFNDDDDVDDDDDNDVFRSFM